ncbi:hypothetical protein CZ771_11205 [Actinomycetales bacterium JB111]|nr:hypothetical protein CZ771_11205 [Actinomycetales bacterium JB111]
MHLTATTWRARAADHARRADAFTADRRERRLAGRKHAVEDFLYEYYPFSPGKARRWHPGAGVELLPDDDAPDRVHPEPSDRARDAGPAGPTDPSAPADPPSSTGPASPGGSTASGSTAGGSAVGGTTAGWTAAGGTTDVADLTERAQWRWHRRTARGGVELDVDAFLADRQQGVRWVHSLLDRTQSRPGRFDCFGWHEWAMVYRQEDHRHSHPLRLGQDGTDRAVESASIRCGHVDAFRFFTEPARPLNDRLPTRANQLEMDQPGCLHVSMDLLRWCLVLGPAVSGDLLLDCAEHALAVRYLDMAAAPYDLADLGVRPVPIETPAGRAEYVRRQREQTERAAPLRGRLLEVTTALLDAA